MRTPVIALQCKFEAKRIAVKVAHVEVFERAKGKVQSKPTRTEHRQVLVGVVRLLLLGRAEGSKKCDCDMLCKYAMC